MYSIQQFDEWGKKLKQKKKNRGGVTNSAVEGGKVSSGNEVSM